MPITTLVPAILLTLIGFAQANDKPGKCELYGKIQFIKAFPDVKVQVIQAFPDYKIQWVDAFPVCE